MRMRLLIEMKGMLRGENEICGCFWGMRDVRLFLKGRGKSGDPIPPLTMTLCVCVF